MIRRLSLEEIIDAAKNLESADQVVLVAAIREQLATSSVDAAHIPSTPACQRPLDNWTPLAVESLSRAYGQSEPQYSEKDLVP